MTETVNINHAFDQIELPDGDQVVLFDRLGKGDKFTNFEKARNVYRTDLEGKVKWKIHSQFDEDGDPFTKLRLENGLTAYRWDGVTYAVDLETGEAVPLILER